MYAPGSDLHKFCTVQNLAESQIKEMNHVVIDRLFVAANHITGDD